MLKIGRNQFLFILETRYRDSPWVLNWVHELSRFPLFTDRVHWHLILSFTTNHTTITSNCLQIGNIESTTSFASAQFLLRNNNVLFLPCCLLPNNTPDSPCNHDLQIIELNTWTSVADGSIITHFRWTEPCRLLDGAIELIVLSSPISHPISD